MSDRVADAIGLTAAELEEFVTRGFIVRRGVFTPAEIGEFAADTDRLLTERRDLIDPKNLRCRFMAHCETGEQLFEVFDPAIEVSPVAARFAADPRILGMLDTIFGGPAVLFKEKLIFKFPGANGYDLHQDIPRNWSWWPQTFTTVLIAIDRATEENGCTEVYEGYHGGYLSSSEKWEHYMLPLHLVDPARQTKLLLEPGDVAIFHGLTPHRSNPNRSSATRRGFYISYNALADGGDRRAWHYGQFHERMRQRLAPDDPDSLYFR